VLPRRIATTKESQRARTTQLLFGQALRMTFLFVAALFLFVEAVVEAPATP
jgi:hypothetical protein